MNTLSTMTATLLVAALSPFLAFADSAADSSNADAARVALQLRGVHFVPNQGQWSDETVHHGFRTRGLDVAFRESSLTMHMQREVPGEYADPAEAEQTHSPRDLLEYRKTHEPGEYESIVLKVTFPGSNAVTPRGDTLQSARFNYFIGDDENQWRSNVTSFSEIIYENLYKGIDLIVSGSDGGVLKYEFHCAPGADHTQIRIRYDGIDSLCIDDAGDLLIETAFGTLRDGAPVVWQEANDDVHVPAFFETLDENTYTITLTGATDPSLPLIIDPEVDWMTYLGGSGTDEGWALVLDGEGNAVIAYETDSIDFEGANNAYYGGTTDAWVAKTDPSGALLWMTYLGGSGREGNKGGIAVDSANNILVNGFTTSKDFAGRLNEYLGGEFDGFLSKLSPDGTLQWTTYFGGSGGEQVGRGVVIDSADNAYVSSRTDAPDIQNPTNTYHGGENDVFLSKVSPSGSVVWSTFLGGASGGEFLTDLAIDAADTVYSSGWTTSTDFEGRNNDHHGGVQDAIALSVDSSGTLQWMTYLGGSGPDWGYRLAVDEADGAVIVGGEAHSDDFEGANNSPGAGTGTDGWLARLDSTGVLEWMTYLAGSQPDYIDGIAIDGDVVYVAGCTGSSDLPAATNTYRGGNRDAYIARMDHVTDGTVHWLTYLGGNANDWSDDIALDGNGSAYTVGTTSSGNFEGRINAYHGGAFDAFLVKFDLGCPADFDNSGDVGVKDLLFLLGAWGPCPKKGDCLADFDNSGDVGVKDLLFLLCAWGPCP